MTLPDPDTELRLEAFDGAAVHAHLDALAELRIRVFREWPYLYDGDRDSERRYLRALADADGSRTVIAFAGDDPVGASTAMPLAAEHAELREPFERADMDPARWYYLAESVLLPAFRGRGAGRRFFELREARAAELGFGRTCFAAVVRDPDDDRRPDDYRELAPFWRRLGYEPREDLVAELAWREIGESDESPKPLRFWLKSLGGAG